MLQKIPTGCNGFDALLDGGLDVGSISLIYGEAETAKTTLAMQCAVNCARREWKVLFVDCDGTFSPRRLFQIASKDAEKIAEHIILARPKDFKEQTVIIDRLTNYLTRGFGLVIFDTITHLYRLEIAEKPEKTFELNRELNRQMAWLAQVAKTHRIAVLVLSQVRGVFEDAHVSIEPVATRVLKFWADVIIAMKSTENAKVIKAIVEKKQGTTQQPAFHFKICEKGLTEHFTSA
ncbi:MAG: ATPase domain-containing protein [Candidatus Bathyarchaeia archaeon]|nr:AAA family ATPase [Candidatus Bathyarchaeota archaeon]